MNFKRLLLFLAAPLALVMSSCEPDGPVYTNPSISITDADGAEATAVNFSAEGGDATITITATRGWSISKQATWLGVTPLTYTNDTMEEKSVDVRITVGPNDGGPRTETIKVVMDKIEKNITVAQADNEGNTLGPKGAGTLEEPYNVARAMEIILAGTYTEDMVYTSGIISQLGEDGREQYGNYTFYISDDGTTAGQLLAYRCKYLNGKNFTISDNLEVGDEVIICGQLVNFKGNTPEIQSCYIVSHNGEMPDAPALKEGVYASDAAFVCNIDNSSKCVYSLGDTNVGGNDVSGFKLGTGSKAGVFTSQAIGVSGDKYLNFYAVAWNGKSSTLYWRVNGGEPMSQTLVANAGANNNAPYNGLVIAATDHYSVQLTGLQATDVIEFSTNSSFSAADDAKSGRAIVFGIKLTDEPLAGENSGEGGGDNTEPEVPESVEIPEGAVVWTIGVANQTWAAETDATLGAGYAATVDNLKVGYYKHTSSTDAKTAYDDHIRVYKNSALVITPLDGKTITKVIMLCSESVQYEDSNSPTYYTFNMSVSDGTTAVCNQEKSFVVWDGNTEKFEAYAVNGQVRIKTLAVVLEGEGGGTTEPEDPEDPEDPETPVEPTVATIASIVALGEGATVAEGTFVEGVVISNSELNNLTSKKGLYIQDETAGLQFYCGANHSFKFGDKVKVDLSGQKTATYNGAVQISGTTLDKFEVISSGNAVEAKTVTMADFLANKYEGQYIALEGVQVVDADLAKTWVVGGKHTSVNMEDAEGKAFVVFSSSYASYGAETVAQGSGTIKGISSINVKDGVTTMQIIFAQATDYAGLTGERFGDDNTGEEPEQPEDPEEPTIAKLTVAEFLAKEKNENVWYELTGVVKNIKNTTYGNFDLVDANGDKVYVYGLTATKVSSNDKSFASLGIVDGDTITLIGVRDDYNGTAQVNGPAYLVSHEVNNTPRIISLSQTSLNYTADGGEKTVQVTTAGEGGTLAATSAAEWLTVSVADGVVTVVAAANEGEAREAEVTVTFGEDSATVTVEQGGANDAVISTVTYDFSTITGSVQYAKETHVLGEACTLTIESCHINTQLRIYSSTTNNGYAIGQLTKGQKITALGFNAGNKMDTLNVYGSTDGTNWTLVEGVAITSTSYLDYSVDFGDTNYTYFKLDVAGTQQVRLTTLTLSYAE